MMPKKKAEEIDFEAVLDLELEENDADAATVREYLQALLCAVWEEGEGFSGKRPFGNSGWEYDLTQPLIDAGLVKEGEDRKATAIICDAIFHMCKKRD